MPISCSQSTLTGSDGSVEYTPAATKFCLKDFSDFPSGTAITVPPDHDFKPGDPVVFIEEDGGSLDSGLTASVLGGAVTIFYVLSTTSTTVTVSTVKGDSTSVVTLSGDGGTGTADSLVGHIKMQYGPAERFVRCASSPSPSKEKSWT